MINCHLIIVSVIYKQPNSSFNDMCIIYIFTHQVIRFTIVFLFLNLHICICDNLASLARDGLSESSRSYKGFSQGHFLGLEPYLAQVHMGC
jgi:hypothetical protein